MALKKAIENKSGYKMEYWRIARYFDDVDMQKFEITLKPYKTAAARMNSLSSVANEERKIMAFDNDIYQWYTDYFSPQAQERYAQEGKSLYKVMYEFIKQHSKEFKNAEDC